MSFKPLREKPGERRFRRVSHVVLAVVGVGICAGAGSVPLPPSFVDVSSYDLRIATSIRYATEENFTGAVVPGYRAPRAILTEAAARALSRAQDAFKAQGYRLVVYDAYRPASSVRAFVAWTGKPSRDRERRRYFPTIGKDRLLPSGYIAERSRHSSASTVDVSLLAKGRALGPVTEMPRKLADGTAIQWLDDGTVDMGTSWDFFGPASRWGSSLVSASARANRQRLREGMVAAGFEPFDDEWWHFSLKHEPFPGQSFDFPIDRGILLEPKPDHW